MPLPRTRDIALLISRSRQGCHAVPSGEWRAHRVEVESLHNRSVAAAEDVKRLIWLAQVDFDRGQ